MCGLCEAFQITQVDGSQCADSAVDRDLALSVVHIDTDQKEQSPHHHRSASQKV